MIALKGAFLLHADVGGLVVAQLALAAGGLGAVQVVLIYSGGPAPPWQVVLPAAVGWVYVTAGVVAWLRRPSNRTGALFTVGGLVWLASGFLNVPQSTLVAFGLIVHWAPDEHRRVRWASLGSGLVVVGWIGQTLIFGAYVRSVADFRTPIGSLEVFIFLATFFYVAAIILLVAMELDELVRADMQRPRNRQVLLPLVAQVIRG